VCKGLQRVFPDYMEFTKYTSWWAAFFVICEKSGDSNLPKGKNFCFPEDMVSESTQPLCRCKINALI
jgi:hypothetical protein